MPVLLFAKDASIAQVNHQESHAEPVVFAPSLSYESQIVSRQRRQMDKFGLIRRKCEQLGAFLRGQELAARHREDVAKTRVLRQT